jgi:hypothetical protein
MQFRGRRIPKRVAIGAGLFFFVGALWTHSHWRRTNVCLNLPGDQAIYAEWVRGELKLGTFPPSKVIDSVPAFEAWSERADHDPCSLSKSRTGFNCSTHYGYESVVTPCWFLVTVAAGLTAIAWRLRYIQLRFSLLTMLTAMVYVAVLGALVHFLREFGYYYLNF